MGRYQADSTDGTKSGPKALPLEAFGRAIQPASDTDVERPNHVIINFKSTTAYQFKYESGTTYIVYGVKEDTNALRVDINPIAWKGGDDSTGSVTFVYGGLYNG